MRILNQISGGILALSVMVAMAGFVSAGQNDNQPNPAVAARTFPSSDAAAKALLAAAQNPDPAALRDVFGPGYTELLTGDKVQDANNAKRFAAALSEGCNAVTDADDRVTFEIGTNAWPMPIPLVKAGGQWHFDTQAGEEEIVSRHIGKDELTAIGACRAYVTAQHTYAQLDPTHVGGTNYALLFKSTPGQRDGLYWKVSDGEAPSPFGPLVAEAHAEGYHTHGKTGPHPFHGYYFRILTCQGKAATGGRKNYLENGRLAGGFALVAYPVQWDKSGIMTFIVNQDGQVYQRNLGEKTDRLAEKMKEYNPDSQWTLVKDDGMSDSVLEK